MEFRFLFIRFTIPHKWMKHPLRFGLCLGAFAGILAFCALELLPFLKGEGQISVKSIPVFLVVGLLVFLFESILGTLQNRKIRKMREQHVIENTLLYETTVRKYTEWIQLNKRNLTGELFLSTKYLQYFPHADIRPDPTFNNDLLDIQSAEVAYIYSRHIPVLAVHRQDETAYFVVDDPARWAGKINQAIAAIRAEKKEDD